MRPSQFVLAALLGAVLLPLSSNAGDERSAREIIRDFDAVRMPSFSDGNSPEAVAKFERAINDGCRKQAVLALELYRAHPDHPRVPRMMATRWAGMTNALGDGTDVLRETAALLESDIDDGLRAEALSARARACVVVPGIEWKTKLAAVDAAVKATPDDERSGAMLMDLAKYHCSDPGWMAETCARVIEHWPDNPWAAAPAKGLAAKLRKIGSEFELDFVELFSGKRVTTASLRGRPVLLQIYTLGFASGASLGEIDRIRALRKRHGERLAVIGLYNWKHDGGPEALRAKLRESGIDWPHAYDESKFDKPWSGPWKTSETPLYYLLDDEGVVRRVSHRVVNLEKAIENFAGEGGESF